MNIKHVFRRAIESRSVSPLVRWFRIIFLIGIWLFIACLLMQVFMVGMAVFITPAWWAMHILFAHVISFLGLVLLAVVFLGHFPRAIWGLTGLIVLLISMQYNTIHLSHVPNLSLSAALHPISAFLLFWAATALGWKTWPIVTSPTDAVQEIPQSVEENITINVGES